MPNRTLTINNADGSSETYTINRDKFEGVRSMERGHVYPSSQFQSSAITAFWSATPTDANDKTEWNVVSNLGLDGVVSFGDLQLANTQTASKVRVGKHRVEFNLILNSGVVNDGSGSGEQPFLLVARDHDADPSGDQISTTHPVFVGHNSVEVEVFDDGDDTYSPAIFFSGRPDSVFDITISNLKVTHEPDTVVVDHTEQPDVRTLLADGETITIDTTETPTRNITIDGVAITIDRSDEVIVESFIEQFAGPKLAFSLRDLASSTGDTTVVDVRRSTDNVIDTFTASEVADGALTTWVGGGNEGFVTKWYDQSGNNHHAIQLDPAKQPKIVDANGLIEGGLDFNDAEALTTPDTFTFPSGTTLSSFITNKAEVVAQNCYAMSFAGNYILWKIGNGTRRVTAGANADFGTISADEELWSVISALDSSGGASNVYVDGVLASNADVYHGTKVVSPARNFSIGGLAASSHWIGTINEVILYDSDQSANLDAINANITAKYGI